jgi:hypothetical protein
MKLEDLAQTPSEPELVVANAREGRGQDFLGLRSPAENVSNRLLNGVTTVTPLIRYLSLRAWIVKRFIDAGGPYDSVVLRKFAAKVEAAITLGNLIVNPDLTGLIGADRWRSETQGCRGFRASLRLCC